jgi:F-type H+-transporting ATPase subunit epsilon
MIQLKLLIPSKILVESQVSKIIAEDDSGFFCLLPRHIDFFTALVPGILSFVNQDGSKEFIAVDEGILVKYGSEVHISVRDAVRGGRPGTLRETVDAHFRKLDNQQKIARAIMARLETGFVRQFIELQKISHE